MNPRTSSPPVADAGPVVVLVGPPGAGKSTVGARLATMLGVTLRDTDADVEALAGKAVSDIFVDDGEPEFRRLERRAVATALAEHDGVLALGGGAVLAVETRAALAGVPVVYLRVSPGAAVARVGLNRDRPLLLGSPRARLRTLMVEREPLYQEVSQVSVDTDDLDPQSVASAVLDALGLQPIRAHQP
jgi:shikimate kinase